MYVETTNICQFKCSYCPMSLREFSKVVGGYKTMSVENFEKIAFEELKLAAKMDCLSARRALAAKTLRIRQAHHRRT